ncbi:MAG: hypothetical protein N2248_06110 [candidate division WOR-3 bacterium]|uniref:WD40 repeat domain-containing protein n=1 Tax=candidate division WOR-3 bacterium TaxID=2052148 RepID=A0A7C3ERH1_UNCW3|nr:hypothetical protein [candidate division WOR-3 bacterium]
MSGLLISLFTLFYQPELWLHYPPLEEIGSVSFSSRQIYIAVPDGIYILDRHSYQHLRTLTSADGITDRIRFCAYNPFGSELLIAGTSHLYSFIPGTGQLQPLNPPFTELRSIGIAQNGAFFDTEKGVFQKIRTLDRFQPAGEPQPPVRWFGEKDTTPIRHWTFLTPYHILDEDLNIRPLTRAWTDGRTGKLYVASPGYGIVVYNLFSGLKEHEIRPGPPAKQITRILRYDRQLWFLTEDGAACIDSLKNWYYTSRAGTALRIKFLPVLDPVLELHQREKIVGFLNYAGNTLIATASGVYTLSPDNKLNLLWKPERGLNDLSLVRDTLLVATDEGLLLLTGDSLIPVTDPFARFDFGVYSIVRADKTFFFGTLGRILRLDTTNTWTQIIPPGFDLSRPVRTMTAGGNYLFIADGSTIHTLNLKNGTWTAIDHSAGLPEEEISALFADERYLWIAGSKFLSRYEYRRQLR